MNRLRSVRLITACAVFCLSSLARAASVVPTFLIGADSGGDSISNLAYTTSDAAQVSAGTDLFAAGGIEVTTSPTFPTAFDFRLVAGLKFASSSETDVHDDTKKYDVDWLRENLELMSIYRNAAHGFRLGIGVNYEFASWINDALANGATHSFKPTTALVFEFDYLFATEARLGIGLRINIATYQSANTRESFSGDGVGLILFTR